MNCQSSASSISEPSVHTKTDWVLSQIRAAIDSGELPPGSFVRAGEWCRRLQVSRTPIHTALIVLEREGYVRIWPHRGAQVIDETALAGLRVSRARSRSRRHP